MKSLLYNMHMIYDGYNDSEEIFRHALMAVDPYGATARHIHLIRSMMDEHKLKRVLVAGFGKAACPMARAMEAQLPDLIDAGIVITKYEHCADRELRKTRIFEAGHPLPDINGLRGTAEIMGLLKKGDDKTLVVCLVSGGGSALLVSPYEGISLEEKQQITELLLKAGADINELNAVRKHISAVKGGRLAEIAVPSKIISLILSDVMGDRPDVIASGPTAPDETTFADALDVISRYHLTSRSPTSIIEVLQRGSDCLLPETPKAGNEIFKDVENIIIGGNKIALDAAKKRAEALGYRALLLSEDIRGEAKEAGKRLAMKARELKGSAEDDRLPLCLISGGETTVRVQGDGTGGRNMELALSFAIEIDGIEGISLLSAGTDGTDGPTDAAGAVVDGASVSSARREGLNPREYLNNNDSYSFFKKSGGLFITGPTETNVMDIQVMIIK